MGDVRGAADVAAGGQDGAPEAAGTALVPSYAKTPMSRLCRCSCILGGASELVSTLSDREGYDASDPAEGTCVSGWVGGVVMYECECDAEVGKTCGGGATGTRGVTGVDVA